MSDLGGVLPMGLVFTADCVYKALPPPEPCWRLQEGLQCCFLSSVCDHKPGMDAEDSCLVTYLVDSASVHRFCALGASTWQSCLHKEATKAAQLPLHALYIVQHKHHGRAWQEGTSADGVQTVHAPWAALVRMQRYQNKWGP